jgi:hypothetical protein
VQNAVQKEEVQDPEQAEQQQAQLTPEQIEEQMFEEAAALAGYTDSDKETSKPEPKEERQADPAEEAVAEDAGEETPVEEPQAKAAPPDPFEGATPEQRQAYQTLVAEKARYEHDSMSNRNRVSALQKKINELEARLEKSEQAPKEAPKAEAKDADLAQDDSGVDLSEFQEDFPEIYRAVNTIYKQQLDRMQSQFDNRLTDVLSKVESVARPIEQMQQSEADAYRRSQIAALEAVHPDWQQLQNSDEFWGWVDQQADGVKALSGSVAASDNIALLNLYKSQVQAQSAPQQQGARPQQPRRQPDVALPRVNSGGRPTSGVPKNDENAAWKYWEDNWDKI